MNKPILILDAGGVIIDDLSTQFWDKLIAYSSDHNVKREAVYKHYKAELSDQLWTAQIDEEHILHFLSLYHINITKQQLRDIIADCLIPLPAYEMVKAWSSKVSIYIMSNHRTHWLLPAIAPIKAYLTEVYVSDSYKMKKPSLDWYNAITVKHADNPIMFVDNTEHNIEAAKKSGWQTIYADKAHKWIDEVDKWLTTIEI